MVVEKEKHTLTPKPHIEDLSPSLSHQAALVGLLGVHSAVMCNSLDNSNSA